MIRIIDRTLSCLDVTETDASDLKGFLELLILTAVDGIELSEKIYGLLAPLPQYPLYILRLENMKKTSQYPGITRFVQRNAHTDTASDVYAEIVLSDAHEAYTTARYADCERVRVQGLDDCLLGDYTQTFTNLKETLRAEIEFCPTNRCYCASALAAEWVLGGFGKDVVTSFFGIGGFAPTEELIMILRHQRLRKAGKTYEFFPEMTKLFARITGEDIKPNKPVIGKRILYVESGVHVDGILKSPKCYEPFPPEIVGRSRKIILGKLSGSASVRAKLEELEIDYKEAHIPYILRRVKKQAAVNNGMVTEEEFAEIAENIICKRG